MPKSLRIFVVAAAIGVPCLLLWQGIFGSFLFTFSIPLIWQVGVRGEPVSTLGLRRKSLWPSVIIGIIAGVVIAVISGQLLRFLGIKGFALSDTQKLELPFGFFTLSFPLQKELSYVLLTRSNSLRGVIFYLLSSAFLIGLGEELFWRGFIQQKFAKYLSKNLAVWVTAAIFGLTHFYVFTILSVKEGIMVMAAVAVIGAIWGYLFVRFNNIWGPALCHGIIAFTVWKYYFFLPLSK